jgi:hypothetical protein
MSQVNKPAGVPQHSRDRLPVAGRWIAEHDGGGPPRGYAPKRPLMVEKGSCAFRQTGSFGGQGQLAGRFAFQQSPSHLRL